jgi:hypothetical protein
MAFTRFGTCQKVEVTGNDAAGSSRRGFTISAELLPLVHQYGALPFVLSVLKSAR